MKRHNSINRKTSGKIQPAEILSGTVRTTERGFAFIAPDSGDKDFFVPRRSLHGALHGDRVEFIRVKGTEDEAAILKITERNPAPLVGTVVYERRSATVYPDDLRRPALFVPRDMLGGAADGQKVVCEITAYPGGRKPTGKVTEILGEEGDLYAEEISIIRAHGLRETFPEEVVSEAQKAAMEPLFIEGRRDLRDKVIFTIDGEDTRDMDDAVSIEMQGGNYVLGVHIADVSYYVKYLSRLDREAYARGVSIYFPDRVLPMLPEALSNGICSLNEGEDRYALSCEITFDENGNRLNYEIFESVIRSRKKTAYEEIEKVINGDENTGARLKDIVESVKIMAELCRLLEQKRSARGGVDMDVNEARIYVKNGEIIIPPLERSFSRRIIEQFMIAANEAVAEFMQKSELPCLYRIHEKPAPEKAAAFLAFLKDLGISAKGNPEDISPRDYSDILAATRDKPYYSVINKIMLRSMRKARYCGENLGHFGLASECYCHFTSPIRRYPDLFVHRSLKKALHGEGAKAKNLYSPLLLSAGSECSDRERIADEAERDVDDLYKLAYMSDKLGEEFEGVVSGVTRHAVYCELENGVEGMIPVEDLPTDNYEFNEAKFTLKGRRHYYRMGDGMKVIIAACDLGRMKVIMKVCPNEV